MKIFLITLNNARMNGMVLTWVLAAGVCLGSGGNGITGDGNKQTPPDSKTTGYDEYLVASLLNELETLGEKESIPDIEVFPEKFKDYGYINFPNSNADIFNMEIFSVDGTKVRTYLHITDDFVIIERLSLPNGEYHFKLSGNNGNMFVGKIYFE